MCVEMKIIPTIFNSKNIRRTPHYGEWWFAVSDIVEALTGPSNNCDTTKEMRKRDNELSKGWGKLVTSLWLDTPAGRQKVECTNITGVLRIAQSNVSPNAEQFKCWLARVGYERIQEIKNPELATNLTLSLYRAKGYTEAWIAKRMYGIAVWAKLTDEWGNRGVSEETEHASLAAEISNATFGLTPLEYIELKGLDREHLRDHMTDLELIFSMLGEAATTEIARKQDAQGFSENRTATCKGGRLAGGARENLEQETGSQVVSKENYLIKPENRKRLTTQKTSNSQK
jgi:DNA-damage-inducible protein D